ncbi:MAG: hypothetical protein ICV73_03290 [Acetobacteraceae bacterium]|nr:hypothetical protein [Acetobacteraceae bacterium]
MALEPREGGKPSARIVLWKAKATGDVRLRSGFRPEVEDRFDVYRRTCGGTATRR